MSMNRSDKPTDFKFVATNTLIVGDIQRSVAFYRDVLGAMTQQGSGDMGFDTVLTQ